MNRSRVIAGVFAGAVLVVVGCGGKVVVDAAGAEGGGGSGGAAVSTSSTGVDAGPAFTCEFGCGGPVGLCGCSGTCSDGKARGIGCGETKGGASCTCSVDGVVLGMCNQSTLSCALSGSCCEALFAQ